MTLRLGSRVNHFLPLIFKTPPGLPPGRCSPPDMKKRALWNKLALCLMENDWLIPFYHRKGCMSTLGVELGVELTMSKLCAPDYQKIPP
jgi:hypothetical protein